MHFSTAHWRKLPPGGINAICDPDVIQRVIMNLLDNAFKYTPVDGRVAVRIERQSADVRVEVSDNGPGSELSSTTGSSRSSAF